jgi:hypothetical protein
MPLKREVPVPAPPLDADALEVISDALDTSHKSSEGAIEDINEAFKQIP